MVPMSVPPVSQMQNQMPPVSTPASIPAFYDQHQQQYNHHQQPQQMQPPPTSHFGGPAGVGGMVPPPPISSVVGEFINYYQCISKSKEERGNDKLIMPFHRFVNVGQSVQSSATLSENCKDAQSKGNRIKQEYDLIIDMM
jgi:hypothetical protein